MSESEISPVDELAEMDDRTNSDGTVNVTIEEWEKQSDKSVRVKFELIDSVESETMTWPKPGEGMEDTKFYQLVESCGLSIRNAELLEGSEARARRVNGRWELCVPDNRTIAEQASEKISYISDKISGTDWVRVFITVFWAVSMLGILSIVVLVL